MIISLLEVCKEWGVLHGGTCRTLKVLEWRLGAKCHMLGHWWSYFTPRKVTWKCCIHIFIRSVSRIGGPLRGLFRGQWGLLAGDLEDSVIHYGNDGTILPQGRYSESFVFISLLDVSQEWESFWGVLGGHWGFLTWDIDDKVILDIMDDMVWPLGSYPESFRLLSSCSVKL